MSKEAAVEIVVQLLVGPLAQVLQCALACHGGMGYRVAGLQMRNAAAAGSYLRWSFLESTWKVESCSDESSDS